MAGEIKPKVGVVIMVLVKTAPVPRGTTFMFRREMRILRKKSNVVLQTVNNLSLGSNII